MKSQWTRIVALAIVLSVLLGSQTTRAEDDCKKQLCPGPMRYYEEIQCKPNYGKPGDCCPVSFDCSHLESRKKDKCYIGAHEYNPRDELRSEDAAPCDIECRCLLEEQIGEARFHCAIVDCPYDTFLRRPAGCYSSLVEAKCCGKLVCPKPEDAVTCQVGNDTYKEGDYFEVAEQPQLSCQCLPGFKGEFVEPYCETVRCGDDLHHGPEVKQGCAPIYYGEESVKKSCGIDRKCPDALDYVIAAVTGGSQGEKQANGVCQFGEHKLNIGDQLRNNGTGVAEKCLRCTCEVPPVLTCVQIPHFDCEKEQQ